jgi:hypothetical protein
MAWRRVCCQQIPEKTLKRQQNRTIMSKIKIVPPFWIISRCYANIQNVWSNYLEKFEVGELLRVRVKSWEIPWQLMT